MVETSTKRTLKVLVGERAQKAGVPSFRACAGKKNDRDRERKRGLRLPVTSTQQSPCELGDGV